MQGAGIACISLGFILFIIWIVFLFNDKFSEKITVVCIIIAIVFIIVGVILIKVEYYNTHYTETEQMLIVVEDKREESHFVGVTGKGGHYDHDYYICFDGNELEVSNKAYNELKINDKLFVEKCITYEIVEDGDDIITEVKYYINN